MMEGGKTLGQGMGRIQRGGQWANSTQSVQKVEEMLSRAILKQEDLWALLMIHSPESEANLMQGGGDNMMAVDTISLPLVRALKAKLEDSMDWCHLALCRLKEIILHSSDNSSNDSSSKLMSRGKLINLKAPPANASPRLKLPTPLSPLHVNPQQWNSATPAGSNNLMQGSGVPTLWSPRSFLFGDNMTNQQFPAPVQITGESDALTRPAQPMNNNILSSSGDVTVQSLQEGQNFTSSMNSALGLDSDWNMVAELSAGIPSEPNLPGSTSMTAISDIAHQSSSTCAMKLGDPRKSLVDDSSKSGTNEASNKLTMNSVATRALRSKCGQKRDRDLNGEDAKLVVVFQPLRPGSDSKRGIPEDGHRGWKKYGNKTIHNSNYCRGYYKCSMKDCNAKKMVQPTDQDPNMFEVTYVGQHTCSSTSQPRSRSRKLKTPETSKKKNFETGPVEEAALLSPDHFPSPSPENVKLDSTLGNDELASHGDHHHQLRATVVSCDKSWTDRLRESLGESTATRSTSDEQSQEEEGEEDEEEDEEDEEEEEDQEEDNEGRRRPSVSTSDLTCHDSDAAVEHGFNLSNSMANMAIPPRPSTLEEELHYQGHDDLMQGGRDDAEILVHDSSQHYGFHQDHILWSSLMESPLPKP